MTVSTASATAAKAAPLEAGAARKAIDRVGVPGWIQAMPFGLVFLFFFVIPLILVVIVSFWDYNDYEMLPSFTTRSYTETFEGCLTQLPDLCTILKTYLSTAKFCFIVWVPTLVIGFTVAYFLAFHVRTATMQMVLFLVCTIPFWTSNVIRMISWIPLLGRNGLVNLALERAHLVDKPVEWLLYSPFSVALAFIHLFTFFMVVPIFNSMMRIDRRLIEAAYDSGASAWQTLWNLIVPLSKPGIVIGSIFVVTIVMGDFITFDVMGGEQIASAGKVVETRLNALQFPPAAANAVILLAVTLHDHRRPEPHRRRAQGALRMNRPSGRPLHRPWAGPPPPPPKPVERRASFRTPFRGMGGTTASHVGAASSSPVKRGRGTMRSMVVGAAPRRLSHFGAL